VLSDCTVSQEKLHKVFTERAIRLYGVTFTKTNLATRVLSIDGFDWTCRAPQDDAVNRSALSWFLAHL
jgi:hypothetical protein